jgi:YCII-related domain
MTAEEADMMKRHAAYWTDLLQRGTAVVFGPVGDPKGVWGVGIVRAGNTEEVNALRDGDPVMTSKIGFQYEILPMVRAVVRE